MVARVGCEFAACVAGDEVLQLAQGLGGFAAFLGVGGREEAGEVEEEGEEELQPGARLRRGDAQTHLRRVVARLGMALPLGGGLGCCGLVHGLFLIEGAVEGKEKISQIGKIFYHVHANRACARCCDSDERGHAGRRKQNPPWP